MPLATPIFAFGLTNLAMLGWLAAAAAPILIHLWSRRQYREMPWAAMEYVLAALQHSRRRILLEQWLLLAVRILIVVLVVLAVAEPYLQQSGFMLQGGQRTHRMLVIDGSFSMDYQAGDENRFDQAKQLATRIVQASPQGDGFTLVLLAAPPRVVVGTPALEPREVLREIGDLTLPHGTADLPATLVKVEEILRDARREYPGLTRHEVYFLTDLCRVGWMPELSDRAQRETFRKRAVRLGQVAELVVIDLGQAGEDNLAVSEVRSTTPYATPGATVAVEGRIQNYGRQAYPAQPVELLVDGRRVKKQQVDVPTGAAVSVGFSHRFDTPGDHTLEIRAAGDKLQIDNRRWLALPVKQQLQVLCIDGRPSGEPFGGATDYLRVALAPQDHTLARSPLRTEVAPESAILELNLSRYDCVMLANVAQFTSSEARVLRSYVQAGGGLVFFLGDRVLAERYNRELARGSKGASALLPARLGPVVDLATETPSRLDPLEYRHPIVAAFRGQEGAGLLTTPILKYFKLKVDDTSKAQVALAGRGGDPLIVEQPIGRGRVVLVATSADVSWTLMPMWPSFVPIVQEMLAHAISGQLQNRNVLVGQPLGASISGIAADDYVTLQKPNADSEQVRLRPQGDRSDWTYAATMTSGIYTAQYPPPTSRTERFAVNVDTVESDLAKLTPQELRDKVWPGVPVVHRTSWEDFEERPVAQIGRRGGLAGGLLQIVLALLLVETYLAWRFGHQTA